jgi:hypothetical protein
MILSSLFKIIQTGVFAVLLNDYLKRTFPEQYDKNLINFSIKAIHLFSKYQLIYFATYNQIKLAINKNKYLKQILNEIYNKDIHNEICQVKRNQTYIKHFYTNISDIHFEEDSECFYIFSDNINASNKCVNKVLLYSQPLNINYEVSNIKFMLLEVKFNGNNYKIDLKNEESNYYIVNNIFDKNFFIYYLKNYQICALTNNDIEKIEKFYVKLIDNDVNVRELEITDKKFILIKKDEYIY